MRQGRVFYARGCLCEGHTGIARRQKRRLLTLLKTSRGQLLLRSPRVRRLLMLLRSRVGLLLLLLCSGVGWLLLCRRVEG